MNNLSLLSLLKIALNHIYVLIIAALVFGTVAFSYCHFLATPVYSATGSVLVTNGAIIADSSSSGSTGSSPVSGTDISASLQLANTINDILKTNDIYVDLAKAVDQKYTYKELIGLSTIQRRSTDTLFIDVSFKASTSEEAIKLVNAYLDLAPEHILKFVPNSTAAVTTTADSASMIYPRTILFTLAAALIGAALAFVAVYAIAFFNNTIKSIDDINDNYKITVIGNIPDFSSANSKSYYKSYGYKAYARSEVNNGKQ